MVHELSHELSHGTSIRKLSRRVAQGPAGLMYQRLDLPCRYLNFYELTDLGRSLNEPLTALPQSVDARQDLAAAVRRNWHDPTRH